MKQQFARIFFVGVPAVCSGFVAGALIHVFVGIFVAVAFVALGLHATAQHPERGESRDE